MKKRILLFISAFFLTAFLWAQRPADDFPYYYYNKSEKSFSDYKSCLDGKKVEIEDNPEHIIRMYKSGNTYYIWTKYKMGQAPSEYEIKHTLDLYQNVAANLDSSLDNDMGKDMSVYFIFTDYDENLICAALYSER